jgi:hypothetical protein
MRAGHASAVRGQVWKVMAFGVVAVAGKLDFAAECDLLGVQTRLGGGGLMDRWTLKTDVPARLRDVPFLTTGHDVELRRAVGFFLAQAIANALQDQKMFESPYLHAYMRNALTLDEADLETLCATAHTAFPSEQASRRLLAEATLQRFGSAVARASSVGVAMPLDQISAVAERLAEYHPDRGRREQICSSVRTYGPAALGALACAAGYGEIGAEATRQVAKVVLEGVLPKPSHRALIDAANAL